MLKSRSLYAELGLQHGVTWKGRNYDRSNWDISDDINRALSAANASFYALCSAVVCSLGYVPSLGFVHDAGTLPFVYDVADLYKHLSSIPAAFLAARQDPADDGELVRKLLKQHVEEHRILQRMPKEARHICDHDHCIVTLGLQSSPLQVCSFPRGVGCFWSGASMASDIKPSNQAMQRTAGRSAFPLSMTSTLNLQQSALSASGR